MDGSKYAEKAVDLANKLAQVDHDEVVVLHVTEVMPSRFQVPSAVEYALDEETMKLAKIIARVLSTTPRYCWDPDGLVAAGGGSGPYYFIRIHLGIEVGPGVPLSHQYLIAMLSHPAIDGIVMETKQFRGGFAVHGKATLEGLPVPIPSEEQHSRIVQLVDQIHTRRSSSGAPRERGTRSSFASGGSAISSGSSRQPATY